MSAARRSRNAARARAVLGVGAVAAVLALSALVLHGRRAAAPGSDPHAAGTARPATDGDRTWPEPRAGGRAVVDSGPRTPTPAVAIHASFAPGTGSIEVRVQSAAPLGSPVAVTLARGRADLARRATRGGVIRFDGLAPDRYRIELDADAVPPGWVVTPADDATPTSPAGRRTVRVRAGETCTAVFPLARAASVVGRVLDERGQPMVGVDVRLQDRERSARVSWAATDDRGEFAIGALPAGTYLATPVPGPSSAGVLGLPVAVSLVEAERGWLELAAAPRRGEIHGRVLDARGEAVAGLPIACALDEPVAGAPVPRASGQLGRARTDAAGAFRLVALPAARVRIAVDGRIPVGAFRATSLARPFEPVVVDVLPSAAVELGALFVERR